MKNILQNKYCVKNASNGVSLYAQRISKLLEIDEIKANNLYMGKARQLIHKQKEVLWSPAPGGSLLVENQLITFHDCILFQYLSNTRKYIYTQLINRIFTKKNVYAVAISDFTADEIKKKYNIPFDRIHVIKTGVPDEYGRQADVNKEKFVKKRNQIIIITNDLPHKNNKIVVQALNRYRDDEILNVHVVGNSSEFRRFQGVLKNVKIHIHEYLPHDTLKKLIGTSHFLIAPSTMEGHNIVVAEALASGTHVIARKIAAHEEYYSGCVDFFDPWDDKDLYQNIIRTISEDPNVLSVTCPKTTIMQTASEYRQLFQELF